jgi:hypothetical protein
MNITTKFNLDEIVYVIQKGGYSEFINCPTCEGVGRITVEATGEEMTCPKCWGRKGNAEWIPHLWEVKHECTSAIGRIQTTNYSPTANQRDETSYMLKATGIGSGTLWPEDSLFSSLDGAKQECAVRNKATEIKEDSVSCVQTGGPK